MKKLLSWLLIMVTGATIGITSTGQPVFATLKLANSKLTIKNAGQDNKITSKRYEHSDDQDWYIIKGTAKKNSKVYVLADKKGNTAANASRITTVSVNKKGKWQVELSAVDKIGSDYYFTQDKAAKIKKSSTLDANTITQKLKVTLPPNKGTEVEPFVASQFATNVTYDQLARTPDQYNGKKVMLEGSVMQTDDDFIMVMVNGDSDQIVHVSYDATALNGNRILEDDLVQFYATAKGTLSYETTNGDENTIPTLDAAKIIDKGAAPDDYGY
ncbi:hypothetical protein ACFQ5J_03115 [Lacticaseibacillus baoqingensis]|uniref:Uncharacterized protein n=1 Tax=Lacticaseibacillus baoqingensis TaxID=2486013 RepID=A0ABW4E604_9LACO|nr:hypothetical protein [Lacticaseibacillus baoqingensis]